MKCKVCGKEIDPEQLGEYATGEFCSTSCVSSYNALKVDNNELKQSYCVDCGKEIWIKKRASPKFTKCDECKNTIRESGRVRKNPKKKRICKVCGQEKPCLRSDVCRKYKLFPKLAEYFGFDLSKKGTIDIYEEFDRVRNLLVEDYWDKEESITSMAKKYNHGHHIGNFAKILEALEIQMRDLSEAATISHKHGRMETPVNVRYRHGWHTTWNNKQVFYRSSYELDYAQKLDEQQIDYDMEGLRILYWDSQKQMQRVAIPDFYLPKYGTIIEIKSSQTYDEQNMKDKFQAYEEHGYNCKIIYEGKEFDRL